MDSSGQGTKRKRDTNPEGGENADMEMQDVQAPRKVVKVRKTAAASVEEKLYDEEGNEIEFEGEVERDEDFVDEEVVQKDDEEEEGWEDEDSEEDEEMEVKPQGKPKEIWDETKAPLQEGEELVFDNSAYQMLHRAKVEWPCLSIDILLPDRIRDRTYSKWFPNYVHTLDPAHSFKGRHGLQTHKQDKFPYTVYFCAGSQSLKKTENKIYVLKWSEMRQTLRDDEDDGSSDEEDQDENYKDPVMRFETIPHRGCVNRIRSMHGSGLVATWSDENEVGIYDITSAYEALEQPATNK